ncbi:MAG: SDR family oxidoreductase, partial [Planctomycetaceae bacterium]
LCREFAKCLSPGRPAHIVNIVDWRALRPGVGHLAYTVSKAGLVALTRILAQELGPQIQVNAIAPGPILPAPGATPEQFAALGRSLPLQRTGRTDDIADALVYLLRSEFVTGEILEVTGGQHL